MTVIRETVYNYLDSTQSPTAPSLAKQFGRWYNYWNSRIDSNDRMDKAWLYMNNYFQANAPGNPNASPPFPFVCNDGGDWSLVGPITLSAQEMGLVSCLFSPPARPNIIYAGSNTGGLWKTENAGSITPTWTCVTDDPRRPAMGVQAIAADPNNSDILYIATGITTHTAYPYGSGVLISADAGLSWTHSGLSASLILEEAITVLKTHPTQSAIVFAGGNGHIYKSVDYGLSWTTVFNNSTAGVFLDMEYLPGNNNIILASSIRDLYISYNGGSTWTLFSPTISCTSHFQIATTQANPNTFYIHGQCGNTYPILINTYTGATNFSGWNTLYSNLGTGVNNTKNEFVINQQNAGIMYVGAIRTYKVINGATTNIHNGNHDDIRDIHILTSSPNGTGDVIIAATDGGISYTKDGATTSWVNKNGYGPQITQFHDIGLTSEKKGYIVGGAQDNHTLVYDGTTWSNVLSGDGTRSMVSWADKDRVYASANCNLKRSVNGGVTFISNAYDMVLGSPFGDYSLQQDPNDPEVLYVAKRKTFEVLRDIGTGNFTLIKTIAQDRVAPLTSNLNVQTNPLTPYAWFFQTIQIAPSNPNIIYVSLGWQFAAFFDPIGTQQKLWRSNDGGNNWFAMGDFFWNIDEIAIDPNNPDRIWVGMQGFGTNQATGQGAGRVFYSDNANSSNATFTDVSAGLPVFAIQSLIYQKHSNDVLYCGNDVGVYRFDAATQSWVCFTQNLPPIIIADLEINYCEGKLYASGYGRGIWSSPLYQDEAWEITTNHTIPAGRKEHHANDITIKSGSTLTVAGTLNMGKGTKIIVEPGAKLYLNGGTITNLCGEVWEGIEVWGSGSMVATQDPSQQGFIEINSGTISYAKEAIQLWKPGYLNTTGGIIKATNATFLNNWRSVEFMQFQNGVLGQGGAFVLKPNVSFFSNCTFEVNDDYREFSASKPFLGHISMWWVDGVRIYGCDFKNSVTSHPLFTKAEDYGYGILAADADFDVYARYLYNVNSGDRSSFSGLFEAIKVSRIALNRAVGIDMADFTNNYYSVFSAGTDNLLLTRSNFTLGKFPYARTGTTNIQEGFTNHVGVGFIVEENDFDFDGTNSTGAFLVGTRIADTDPTANRLYRNTVNGLFANNLANGINGGPGGTIFPQPGLKYLCNGLSNGSFDMVVSANPGDPYASVAEDQFEWDPVLNQTISAANTFSSNPYVNIWNIGLGTNPLMQYRYWATNANENPGSVQNVNKATANRANDCPTNFTGPTTTDPYEMEALTAWVDLFYTQTQYETDAKNDWTNQLDAGDSNLWLDKVNNADAGSAEDIKAELLSLAPWASEPVLIAMVNNAAFSSSQLLEVLEVHPDVLRKATFFSFLQNDQSALDYSQVKGLEAFASNVTARTDLAAAITSANNDKVYAGHQVIRHYLNDTVPPVLDTLKNWYLNIGDIPSDYAITALYWEYNQINDATTWLEDMPNRHNFTSKEQENYDDYKSLKELFKNVFSDNRSLLGLNSAELATLTTLAEKGVALASVQAQNLLNFAYNGNYRKEAYLPEIIQERKLSKEEEEILIENPDWIIKAVPNPTRAQTVLSYQLGDIEGEAHLYVHNIKGQQVFMSRLQKPLGEVLINTSEWSPGTYFCVIRIGKEQSKVYKLSVAK